MDTLATASERTSAVPVTLVEAEAQELEGLCAVDTNTVVLLKIKEFDTLREQKKAIDLKMDVIKRNLGATLEKNHLQAFTVGGKAIVRLSEVTTHTLDSIKLKAKHPRIWAAFQKVTVAKRVTIGDL